MYNEPKPKRKAESEVSSPDKRSRTGGEFDPGVNSPKRKAESGFTNHEQNEVDWFSDNHKRSKIVESVPDSNPSSPGLSQHPKQDDPEFDKDSDGFGPRSSASASCFQAGLPKAGVDSQQPKASCDARIHQENMLQAERLRSRATVQLWERPASWGVQLWERKQWFEQAPPITAARALFVHPIIPDEPVLQTVVPPLVRPLVLFASKRLRLVKPKVDSDGLRQRALVKWRVLIEQDLLSSRTGTMIAAMCENLDSEESIAETITDVFACKATATLFKRANSFCQYLEWATNSLIERPMLCTEIVVYNYLKFLRSSGAAPTKASAFVQSLNFAKHVIGLQCSSDTTESARIRGAVRTSLLNKRMLKQAEALYVTDMEILEDTARYAPCVRDQVASGHFCFESYCCGRHTDTNNVEELMVDVDEFWYGFLEGSICKHKTATTAEKKTKFLPHIAPSIGVRDYSWAKSWLEARDKMGMQVGKNIPLLPAPDSQGGWTSRPLTAGEATCWLRDILTAGGSDPAHVSRVSSHSMKATLLSWGAKRGLMIDIRRLLGHHLPPGDLSAINYSRDAMTAPLQAVVNLLAEIRSGTFLPDNPRSSRIVPTVHNADAIESNVACEYPADYFDTHDGEEVAAGFEGSEGKLQEPVFDDTQLSESDPSEEGSDDLGSEDLCEGAEEDLELVRKFCPNLLTANSIEQNHEVDLFQHVASSVVHYATISVVEKFLCGRPNHCGYNLVSTYGSSLWPLCKQCVQAHNSSVPDPLVS